MRWLTPILAAMAMLFALSQAPSEATAQSLADKHWVKGYTRKDGTYVPGHWAKDPKPKASKTKSAAKPKAVSKTYTPPKPPPVREKKALAPKAPKAPVVRDKRPSGGGSSRGSSSKRAARL